MHRSSHLPERPQPSPPATGSRAPGRPGTGGRVGRGEDTLIPWHAVRHMFDAVAPRYDLLNRVLSLGIDRRWRRRAIAGLALGAGDLLVDVCGGTGDLGLEARRLVPDLRVLDVDFSAAMLRLADRKGGARPLMLALGDATQLPVATGAAAGVVVGFGIRNVPDRLEALREFHRVLRPGGRLAILEFGLPRRALVRGPYLFYLRRLLPRIAALMTGAPDAYRYLGDSILDFPARSDFAALLEEAGFGAARWRDLSLGIAVLHEARR